MNIIFEKEYYDEVLDLYKTKFNGKLVELLIRKDEDESIVEEILEHEIRERVSIIIEVDGL